MNTFFFHKSTRKSSKWNNYIPAGIDSTPEIEDIRQEPINQYSTSSIMRRLGQINKPEWKWIFAALITVTLKGTKVFSILQVKLYVILN